MPVFTGALGRVRGAPEPKAAKDEAAAVASGAASEYARRGTLSLPSTTLSIASSRKLESSVEVTDSLLTRYLSICLKNVFTTLPASNCENVYSCSCLLLLSRGPRHLLRKCKALLVKSLGGLIFSPAAVKTVHPVCPTVAVSVVSSEVLAVLVGYLWNWRLPPCGCLGSTQHAGSLYDT